MLQQFISHNSKIGCPESVPNYFSFARMHLLHLQDTNPRCSRDAQYLWSMHAKNYASWLKKKASYILNQVKLLNAI